MDISRYIIFAAEVETSDLLTEWRWIISKNYSPVMITKFGEWFFRAEANRLIFLDLLEGSLFDLGDLVDVGLGADEFISTYKNQLSVDWIEVCIQKGMVAKTDQCYAWKVHPILGGSLSPENIKVFSLKVYQSLMGQLFRQVRPGMRVTGFTLKHDS